jgi:DNA-binding response OmpR family regulator
MGIILAIEDDEDIRDVFAEALRFAGHELLLAATGRQGLTLLRAAPRPPDLMLLDLMLPDMSGGEILAEVRREPRWAKMPVVIVSASGRDAQARFGLDVDAVLRKPVELDDLLATVARFVDATPSVRAPQMIAESFGYLERRRADLGNLQALLARGAHHELRIIGHNLKGTAGSFGFPDLGARGAELEEAAASDDEAGERRAVEQIIALLERPQPNAR